MAVTDLLEALRERGLTVNLGDGDGILVSPKSSLTDDLRTRIREHKAGLLAALRPRTCCRCEVCSPTPAPTYTERYRRECEARHVANLPDDIARTRYLQNVAAQRGQDEAALLLHATQGISS